MFNRSTVNVPDQWPFCFYIAGSAPFGWNRFLLISGIVFLFFMPPRACIAQSVVPTELVQLISQLTQKLNALKDDRGKLDAALKQLDGEIDSLRSTEESSRAAALLVKWLYDLRDNKKDAVRQDATFKELFAATDRMRDATDFARASRLSEQLVAALQSPRLTKDEDVKLTDALGLVANAIVPRLKDQPVKIHIISAKYGVLESNRICDAKAYFRAKCEGQTKCPVPAASPSDSLPLTITGAELCGFEPAPLADAGASKARVEYSCTRFGLRPWTEIDRTVTKGTSLDFSGKGQITCDFP